MADFGLKEPFDIDDGELDGIPPHVCFVLGVEWQMASATLDGPEGAKMLIHSANASRIKRMCIRRRRGFRVEATESSEWMQITIAHASGEFPE